MHEVKHGMIVLAAWLAGSLAGPAWCSGLFTPEMSDWYPFESESKTEGGEIGMADWLDKPAGRLGRIVMDGGQLRLGGEVFRIWGLNNEYADCFPQKEIADFRAAFYAKYGINCVRQHKYADGPGWQGLQSQDSALEFDPESLDRFDYYNARLKEQGIYVGLSSNFGVKVGPADRALFEEYDEFLAARDGRLSNNRISTGHGAVWLSPSLQQIQIDQFVKMLQHRNPYTGLTYAEDPAVAYVELFNEDTVLFYTTITRLRDIPSFRKRWGEEFSDWLREKYGSHEGLVAAWGELAIDALAAEGFDGEHLDKRNIVPAGNPWFYDPAQLEGDRKYLTERMHDTMEFLIGLQDDFYARFVQAIRDAGFEGPIVGSNWQAGSGYGHYHNLYSDYKVGIIDRHNYFGGGGRSLQLKDGQSASQASQLDQPGSGLLSSGMQQVYHHPFMFSEWNVVQPTEWYLEGPAIIGAYGMGLQGWDASFIFAAYRRGFSANLDDVKKFSINTPPILGLFPAVSRHVLRGDIRESDTLAVRNVAMEGLRDNGLGFRDRTVQQWDVKSFDSDKVPHAALAAAKVVVKFTDQFLETSEFPLGMFKESGSITSSTGELTWFAGGQEHTGHFVIDTPSTKAVVGFLPDKPFVLGNVTIHPKSGFSAVYVTCRDEGEVIESADALLIVAMARARNTGQEFTEDGKTLLKVGQGPILMEPVKATVQIQRASEPAVTLLDHDGLRTGRICPVESGAILIDGTRDRTPYYLVRFE